MLKKILVTGSAGFIGSAVAERLLSLGFHIVGVDNMNNFYDPKLKIDRIKRIEGHNKKKQNFEFLKLDLRYKKSLVKIFKHGPFEKIIHFAAQAGVRYSIKNPSAYVNNNIITFSNLLEAVKDNGGTEHLVYASSSSVYGGNIKLPFTENQRVDQPVNIYAATKKSNELMSFVYSHLYGIPTTGLRLFTVYGPWGRPDMALFKFVKLIISGKKIEIYNEGQMWRDFTYIDDAVDGIIAVLNKKPRYNASLNENFFKEYVPYQILNLGNSQPQSLNYFLSVIEKELGIKANKVFKPIQSGEVTSTFADMKAFNEHTSLEIKTPLKTGVRKFINWYREYYGK